MHEHPPIPQSKQEIRNKSSFPLLSQIVSDNNISLVHCFKFELERFVLQGQETAKTLEP